MEVTGIPDVIKNKITWTGATSDPTNSFLAKQSRSTSGDTAISVKYDGSKNLAAATLKVVWGTANIFNQDGDTKPDDCEEDGWLPNGHRPGIAYGTWNRMVGQFTITPASLRTVPGTKFIIESRILKGAGWVYYKRPTFPASWTFDAEGLLEDNADGPDLSNTDSTLSEQGHLYYADMPGWQNPPNEIAFPSATRAAQKINFTHTVYVQMPEDRGGLGTKKLRIAEIGKWHTVSFCKKQANGNWARDNDTGSDNSIGVAHKPFTWNEQAP